MNFMKKGGLIACVLVLAFVLDFALAQSYWVRDSGYFWLDDFELTQREHPEEVWEKVIYGSSELTSGYREDLSESGYVNMGMDYATITDLVEILEGGHITVGSELVLALNWGALSDIMDTNPTYEWHRKWYEPYFYFQRDRIAGLITDTFNALIRGGEFRTKQWLTQTKAYYYGQMSQAELEERVVKLHDLYLTGGLADFQENLAALNEVFAFCEEHGSGAGQRGRRGARGRARGLRERGGGVLRHDGRAGRGVLPRHGPHGVHLRRRAVYGGA